MITGFIFAIITGLTWTAIGVVLSRCAKDDFDVITYSLLQTAFTALFALVMSLVMGTMALRDTLIVVLLVFGAGLFNSIAQNTVKIAMERGNHGPAWAISQSSFVIPFIVSTIFWGASGSVWQWCGVAMIICGIIIPVAGKFQDFKKWIIPTVIAFLLFGLVQTLMSAPSQLDGADLSGEARTMFVGLGGVVGWELLRQKQKAKLKFNKRTLYLSFFMAVLMLVSLKTFFASIDKLSTLGHANIGVPLMVGSNIIAFTLYSLIVLREKINRIEAVGMASVLAGIVLLAF